MDRRHILRIAGGGFIAAATLTTLTACDSSLPAEAIAAYVDTNEWQLAEIQAALAEADARDYATDQDMADLALKWNAGAH